LSIFFLIRIYNKVIKHIGEPVAVRQSE
jgi:hypothetical protein